MRGRASPNFGRRDPMRPERGAIQMTSTTSTATPVTPAARSAKNATSATRSGRLFVLELNAGRIHLMNTDGSDQKTIVSICRLCDGIVVDVAAGHIYWADMGVPSLDDGSIERADLDGSNRKVIVPQGVTY